MFATMTTIKGDVDDLEYGATMAGEALIPWVSQFDGYKGMIVMADVESGTAHFVTFWENEEALERSARGRKEVREQMARTAGVEIESARSYTVRLVDGLL